MTAPLELRTSIIAAGHQGESSLARDHLHDADPAIRRVALSALHRVEQLQAEELAAALRDDDAAVRRSALTLAATRLDVAILTALTDEDPTVVEVAAWATGEREDDGPQIVTALTTVALEHEDSLCREAAVAALGAVGDPTSGPVILRAMQDKATVRRRAVLALAAFEGEAVLAALHAATQDRDWQVRQGAEDLLGVIRSSGPEDDIETGPTR